jgi:general stress protein 26
VNDVQPGSGRAGSEDLESLRGTGLDQADLAELVDVQVECTLAFLDEHGWPHGVVMLFIVVDGRFWLTSVEGRVQVRGLEVDDRATVVVSSAGSGLSGRRMVAVHGHARIHRDAETKDWFLDASAEGWSREALSASAGCWTPRAGW